MKTKLCLLLAVVWTTSFKFSVAAEADLSKLAAANNTFAFKLLKQLSTQQLAASVFVSPYSAATALQMAANGASGQTKTEMQQVLGTSGLSAAALNAACRAASELLNPKDTNVILTTANALWYRQGAAVKPGFLEANQEFFSLRSRRWTFATHRRQKQKSTSGRATRRTDASPASPTA